MQILKNVLFSKVSRLSALTVILVSNTVIAENYQSFSALNYSHEKTALNVSGTNFSSKSNTDNISLFSQYFFDQRETLGPLNEFDYINNSSNVYAQVSNSDGDRSHSFNGQSLTSTNKYQNFTVGGQWVTHNILVGINYNHSKSELLGNNLDIDESDNTYSASLGYFISEDFVVGANYNDGGDGDDSFKYSASYNLQLADTDYIGFSYSVDDDFDIHSLSSRYFFGLSGERYVVLGGNYNVDNSDNLLADDSWSVNSSYYFNQATSISAYYGDDDSYGFSANYFINNNYALRAGYNSRSNDKNESDLDGYSLNFTAQF